MDLTPRVYFLGDADPVTTQLRVYTINKGKLGEFVKLWREGIRPIREKLGFKIEGAWTIPERNEFVWIMSYDDPEDWDIKDKTYFASPERAALNPDPALFIAKIDHWFLTPVL